MEGETRTASDCSGLIKAQTITVLVVDDDTTCLSIVAAKLKKFQYQVATVKHPNDALCTLRIKGDAFDLVVSDVHMPDMNGIQLQQVIAREFKLPVVLMSADGEEDVVLEGLESGAAFYIVKPVSTDDLKDLWQFAMTKKKKSRVVIEESAGSYPQEIINKTSTSDENEIAGSAASVNEARHDHYKDSKRKSPKKEGSSGESSQTASQKRQKVVWTNSLHNRFLEAIRSIGLDRAVPKKILEVMNVPSLTRENVASHLQKYRIFLRRVIDEASLKLECSDKSSSSRTFSPIFTPSSSSRSSPSTLFLNNLTRMHNQKPENFLGARNAFFLNQEGSSSYLLGQSRLLSNRGTMLNPKVVGTNQTADNESVRLVQNIYQNTTSVQGNISRALSPNFDPLVLDSTTGVNSETADYNSYKNDGINIPNFNSLSSTTSMDSALHTDYVGLKIWNIQHLLVEKQPACDGRINNLASDLELQNSSSVGIGPGPNESPAINVDQIGGDQLWDDVLAAKCQMLVHSNVYKVMGNGLGESTHDYSAAYSYSPMFDLDELTNLPLDQECNLSPNIPTSIDQVVNVQNQVQDYNNVSSFDQALNERDDDEFLESLLATGPGLFEENHHLEGI